MSDNAELPAAVDVARARVTQFVCHVEGAAVFLKAAHPDDRVRVDARRRPHRPAFRSWHSAVIENAASLLHRLLEVFDRYPAEGPGIEAELEAFRTLSELTPAGPQLRALLSENRTVAVKELVKHLDLVRRQFQATAALEESLTTRTGVAGSDLAHDGANGDESARVREALLERAGGALSLTEAAAHLGVSRQALHKRIVAGTALGMMRDGEIAVPKLQFDTPGDRVRILPGIDAVTKLFEDAEAGPWMALQFLVEPDPNLGEHPIMALRSGEKAAVVQAARAYLRFDED